MAVEKLFFPRKEIGVRAQTQSIEWKFTEWKMAVLYPSCINGRKS